MTPATFTAGRELPHSLEAEAALIACCIVDGADAIARCIEERIQPEAFYSASHRAIYEALRRLYDRRSGVDTILLCQELHEKGALESAGGPAAINEITNRVATTMHLGDFARIVREKHMLRRLVRQSAAALEGAFEAGKTDTREVFERAQTELFALVEDQFQEGPRPIREAIAEASEAMVKWLDGDGRLRGLPTGYADLDERTGGWEPGQMIVLAARPSLGKTSLAMNMVETIAMPRTGSRQEAPVPVAVFSLEMTRQQIAGRMMHARSRVPAARVTLRMTTPEQLKALVAAGTEIKEAPITIDQSSNVTIGELRAKARGLRRRQGIGFIVIDYLQLLAGTDPKEPREQQISEISRGIKAMAKELNIPVLVLSQLNRESERQSRRPRLSDLRESGSIEQDADVVLLLSKPIDEPKDAKSKCDDARMRFLEIAKNRNGPVGGIELVFLADITRFENAAHS